MEVVHLGKYYWPDCGGIETATKNLAELGADLGYRVSCVVSGGGTGKTIYERIGAINVTRHPIWAKLLSAPISPRLFGHPLRRAQVLHLHLPHPMAELAVLRLLFTSALRPRATRVRLIPFLHATPLSQGWLGRLWFAGVTRPILDRSEMILVSSHKVPEAFSQLARWREKFHVLPFHVESWSDELTRSACVKRAVARQVCAVGRLVPYKGFDVLLRAWGQAYREFPFFREYRLSIAGDGPELARLFRIAHEEGIESVVDFAGRCSEVEKNRLLTGSSFFVAPSVSEAETFGISILEAMSCGLPVITTRLNTGVSVLAREGKCGAVVAPGSVDELAEALVDLAAAGNGEWERVGQANLEFARDFFSRDKAARNYDQLLHGGANPATCSGTS